MRSAAFPYYNARGDLATRTDARGITTTYTYDALHRLTQKVYSDGTPAASYFYDQTAYNGLTIANGKGRRTGMSDGSGATAWSYDGMGRVLAEEKTIAGITKTLSYAYNLDGSASTVSYPTQAMNYTYNGAQQATSVVGSGGFNWALNGAYAPQGALTSMLNGQSATFGGVTWSASYNNRLLPATLTATSSNGTALSLAFSYLGNGNVSTVTNNRDSNRTESFTYDALNRVATAQTATTAGACWGQSYGYDRYGNLTGATVTQCTAPALSLSVNGNNQVTNPGFGFDLAGNTTSDGSYNYTWDAEGRMKTAAGVTYTYDGDGERVEKSSGTLYWFGVGGEVLEETDLAGNWTNDYIYFAGQRMGRIQAPGPVYLIYGDLVGSARAITTSTGTLCYDADFYPFGGERVITNTCGENYKFTGMERDSETGNDHTLFRQYASNLGRWLSPDPLGGDVTNPQSLNRYAYVLNNPTNFIDPLGLQGPDPDRPEPRFQDAIYKVAFGCGPAAGDCYYGNGFQVFSPFFLNFLASSGTGFQPPQGFIPVSRGAQGDCPNCFFNPATDETFDPNDPRNSFFPNIPGITFTQTGPTTATFVSKFTFTMTVQKFKDTGFNDSRLDKLFNPFHSGQLDLRDRNPFCSAHITVDKNSGQAEGVPTTGSVHLDTVNPTVPAPYPPAQAPDESLVTQLIQIEGHQLFDVARLYPGSEACR